MPTYRQALPGQLLRAGLYLVVLVAAHFFWLHLKPGILWTLVAVIAGAAFVPPRFSELASAAGFLIVAGVAYFNYGQTAVAALCAVFGVITLISGVRAASRGPYA